ncbi:MAG: tetratricopeptide repeat protein [Actinomycetota bacterium]
MRHNPVEGVGAIATCASCSSENPDGARFCNQCGASFVDETQPNETIRKLVSAGIAERVSQGRGHVDERRLVTALFADISGFTALSEQLDPEQLVETIDPILAAMTDIATRYEANIGKYAGDAILCLFGAPIAHEDDAARALYVALEMHEALDRLRPSLIPQARELSLHIGVNTGHVVAALFGGKVRLDYNVLGDSVNLAQRLESAAPPGQTYVGLTTMNLTESEFEFERVSDLTLKGKKEPVPAWRLVGRARTKRSRPTPFVGRTKEQALLAKILHEKNAAAVAIVAEPGVGKSRLLQEAARNDERLWLSGSCASYASHIAYRPYIEMLRGYRANGDASEVAEILALMTGEATTAELEPEARRRKLHDRMTTWISRCTRSHGAITIAVDDLHWSDASSIELTSEIVRTRLPVCVLLATRPEARERTVNLVESAPSRYVIELEPLANADVSQLVAALVDGSPPTELASIIEERSGGNPFFVEELIRALLESGALSKDGSWQLAGEGAGTVPATIEGLISSRIDRLPPAAAAVLGVASVIGQTIRLSVLARMPVPVNGTALDQAVELLIEHGFVKPVEAPEPAIAFRHALAQEVTYGRLLRRRRAELHGAVAGVIESQLGSGDDIVASLARHRYLAGDPAAAPLLIRAATLARSVFANEEALVHLERALEVTPSEDRAPILLDLADLHDLCGRYDEAFDAYDRARALDPGNVRAWCGCANALCKKGSFDAAVSLIEEALALTTTHWDTVAIRVEQGWALSSAGRYEDALAAMRKGLLEAGDRDDVTVGRLLIRLARAETIERQLESALEHAERAIEIFEQAENVRGMTAALREIASVYHWLGRLDDAADSLHKGLQLCERIGNVEETAGSMINLALIEMERGNLEEAIDLDRKAIEEFERIGHAAGRAIGYGNLADKLTRAQRFDEAMRSCERALELAEQIGRPPTQADVTRTKARIHLAREEITSAIEQAERAAALYLEMAVPADAAECLTLAADAHQRAGDEHRASELLSQAQSLIANEASSE